MGKTVLIVDDDPTQRRILQAVIEKSGFSTLQASDGDAALEMAHITGRQENRPHVAGFGDAWPRRNGYPQRIIS